MVQADFTPPEHAVVTKALERIAPYSALVEKVCSHGGRRRLRIRLHLGHRERRRRPGRRKQPVASVMSGQKQIWLVAKRNCFCYYSHAFDRLEKMSAFFFFAPSRTLLTLSKVGLAVLLCAAGLLTSRASRRC